LFGPWVLGAYPLLRLGPLAVSLLQRVPFSNAKKEPKGLAPGVRHFAQAQCSLATVFIRGHRLRFASLRLLSMYAATLHGAARLLRMNTFARPADGGEIKSQIKSRSQSRSKDRSLRQLQVENGGGWRILERLL
jgi:hypothetical protein